MNIKEVNPTQRGADRVLSVRLECSLAELDAALGNGAFADLDESALRQLSAAREDLAPYEAQLAADAKAAEPAPLPEAPPVKKR